MPIEFTMLQMRFIKQIVCGCFPISGLLAAFWLLAVGVPVMASSSGEEALRTRVDQLYAALEQGDWPRAEKYITKESKPFFRSQAKQPVPAHQIQSIKLGPGGDTATVVVQIPVSSPMMPQPTLKPQTTQWRRVRGVWFWEFAKPDPNAMQSLLDAARHPPAPTPPPPPVPDELKFESVWVGLEPVHHGEVRVARFPFTNVSNHDVEVEILQLPSDCLRMKPHQKLFKPGESGVLEFEFDPSNLPFNGTQPYTVTVWLQTHPGGARAILTIAALLEPGNAPPPKP
jgi:hypothetical protein